MSRGIRLTIKARPSARLVRQGLQNLKAEVPRIGKQRMYEAMQRIVDRLRIYPPERPNQRYVRTYRLKASWAIRSTGNGWRVSNSMPYAKYPLGNAYGGGQAWMHVGRWTPFRDVVEAEMATLPQTIQREMTMVARRFFG